MSLYDAMHRLEVSLDREEILPCAAALAFAEHFTPWYGQLLFEYLRDRLPIGQLWRSDHWACSIREADAVATTLARYVHFMECLHGGLCRHFFELLPAAIGSPKSCRVQGSLRDALRELVSLNGRRCMLVLCRGRYCSMAEWFADSASLQWNATHTDAALVLPGGRWPLDEAYDWADLAATLSKEWFQTEAFARGQVSGEWRPSKLEEVLSLPENRWGAAAVDCHQSDEVIDGDSVYVWATVRLGGGSHTRLRVDSSTGEAQVDPDLATEAEFVVPPIEQWAPWLRKIVEEDSGT